MNRRYLFLMLFAFTGMTVWATAEPPHEEPQERFETLRKQPEQFARLRENLNAFLALPQNRQTAITKLDQDLHDAREKNLWLVLERYADWLDKIRQDDPAAYQAIKDAPNATARLALIKEQRDGEWMSRQPKAIREKWAALKGEARADFAASMRKEDRQRRAQWVIAKRFAKELDAKMPLPSRLSDFAVEVKKLKDKDAPKTVNRVEKYVNEYLKPYMTMEEEQQLKEAEGRWPDYPQTLVEIASRRTPALLPAKDVRRFNDLPAPVRTKLITKAGKDFKKLATRYRQLEDDKGNFGSRLVQAAAEDGKLPFENEFLASSYASLSKPMKKFWDKELLPVINDADKAKLIGSENRWPDFPLTIQELALKHNLQPPWFVLPDTDPPTWHWDRYRDVKARSWTSDAKDKKQP